MSVTSNVFIGESKIAKSSLLTISKVKVVPKEDII